MNISLTSASIVAIECANLLNLTAQEVGRALPETKPQYISLFYDFLIHDHPQGYELRSSALRTKIESVRTELRCAFNHTNAAVLDSREEDLKNVKKLLLQEMYLPAKNAKLTFKSNRLRVPEITIDDEYLRGSVIVQGAQAVADKMEEMSAHMLNDNWEGVEAADKRTITNQSAPSEPIKNRL